MGLQIGCKAKVIKVWTYFSVKNKCNRTRALIYVYDRIPAMECKVEFVLTGDTKKKGLKAGEEITIMLFEVIGNKNQGYEFFLHEHETRKEEKRQEWLEQFIGSFDLPDENPFDN